MLEAATPAEMRAYILERLVGKPESVAPDNSAQVKLGKSVLASLASAIHISLADTINVGLSDQKAGRLTDWLAALDPKKLVILYSRSGDDASPLAMAIDARTVSLLTHAAFGGDPVLGQPRADETISGIETGFLSALRDIISPVMLEFGIAGPFSCRSAEAGAIDHSELANGDVTIVTFSILVGTTPGQMQLLLPSASPGSSEVRHGAAQQSSSWKTHLSEELGRSKLRVEAVLDLATHTLSRLKTLQVGDVLAIPEGSMSRSTLFARGEPIFTGKLGRLGDSYSIRISGRARKSRGIVDSIVKGFDGHATSIGGQTE